MFDLDLIERALDDAVADAAELLERKLQEYAGREDNPHVALYRDAVILAKDARAEFAKLRDAGHAKGVPSLLCGRTPDGRHYVLTGEAESVNIVSDLIAASEVKAEVTDEMVDAALKEKDHE